MEQTTLIALVNQVVHETFQFEFFAKMIDGRGVLNSHLAFPVNADLLDPCKYLRREALPAETQVFGRYLVLTYWGHEPRLWLTEHSTLESMQDEILCPSGILNVWTEFQFAFENFKLKQFRIDYIDLHGITKRFDQLNPECVSDDWDMESPLYNDVTLTWLAK